MDDYSEPTIVSAEFRNECTIRSATRVLQMKQQSIHEEIQHLIRHIALLVPALERPGSTEAEPDAWLLAEALKRMGDDAFANLVLQALERR